MYYKKNSFLKHIDFFIIDIVSLFLSFLLAIIFRIVKGDFVNSGAYQILLLWMIIPLFFCYIVFSPYKDILKRSHLKEIQLAANNVLMSFVFTVVLLYIMQMGIYYSRLIIIYTYVFYFFLSILFRIIWKELILKGVIKTGTGTAYNLFVICKKENAKEIVFNIINTDYGKYTIKGIYLVNDEKIRKVNDINVIQNKEVLYDFVIDNNINEIFIASQLNSEENNIVRTLISEGIEIQLHIDSLFGIESEDSDMSNVGMYNTLQLNSYTFSTSQRFYFVVKRFLDIIISFVGCIAMIIMYIIIKIAYLMTGDDYPVIFKQKRIGLDGKEFDLYKFRTMVPNADEVLKELLKDKQLRKEWNKNQKLDNDPRITKVGKILRKTSLDELPQFVNVLKGEMSIIGPRPLVPGELKSKNGIKLYEKVKPGITGWWACNGRSNMSYEERLEHEYYYVRNCSLYLDILCVLRTIYVVAFGKGAK